MSGRADTKAIVRRALACPHGWRKLAGTSSTGHAIMELPNGMRVQVSWSPGDRNSPRNLARQLADACGCPSFWDRAGSGKRSRKADDHTDFDPSKAAREQERFAQFHPELAEMPRRHAALVEQLRTCDPRREQARAVGLARQLVDLECEMGRRHIPFERMELP